MMLKRGFKTLLAEANAVIETVSVADLDYHLDDKDAVLVDVRETVEREQEGTIPGSVTIWKDGRMRRLGPVITATLIPGSESSTVSIAIHDIRCDFERLCS